MSTRIQLRRGTAAAWAAANPVLASGEPGVESDTGRQKIGDGTTAWVSLPYTDTSPAARISDSTTVGRSLVTATDAAAARTAIGLGSASDTADANKPLSKIALAALDQKASRRNPYVAGMWLTQPGSTTTQQLVDGLVYLSPLPSLPVDHPADGVAIEIVNAGSAGSLIRILFYDSDWQNLPGQLLLDAGTVPGTVVGVVEIAPIVVTLPTGTAWVGVVGQGNPATAPIVRANASSDSYADTSATAMAANGRALIGAVSFPAGSPAPRAMPIVNPFRATFRAPRTAVRLARSATRPNPVRVGESLVRNGTTYYASNASQEWSAVVLPNGVDRFEVRPGDRWYPEVGNSVERSELVTEYGNNKTPQPFSTIVWAAFAFRVTAPAIDSAWLIAGQFRGTDDAGDITSRSPCFSQILTAAVNGYTFEVVTRSDTAANSTTNPAAVTRYSTTLAFGTWYQVVYKLRFEKTGNGLLSAWVNGTNVYPETAIPIGYNDTFGPGWKYGVYRASGSAQTVVIEYANMEIGTTDLSARVATPLTIPTEHNPALDTSYPGFSAHPLT